MTKPKPTVPKYDPATTTLSKWLEETNRLAKEHPTLADRIKKARAAVLRG